MGNKPIPHYVEFCVNGEKIYSEKDIIYFFYMKIYRNFSFSAYIIDKSRKKEFKEFIKKVEYDNFLIIETTEIIQTSYHSIFEFIEFSVKLDIERIFFFITLLHSSGKKRKNLFDRNIFKIVKSYI